MIPPLHLKSSDEAAIVTDYLSVITCDLRCDLSLRFWRLTTLAIRTPLPLRNRFQYSDSTPGKHCLIRTRKVSHALCLLGRSSALTHPERWLSRCTRIADLIKATTIHDSRHQRALSRVLALPPFAAAQAVKKHAHHAHQEDLEDCDHPTSPAPSSGRNRNRPRSMSWRAFAPARSRPLPEAEGTAGSRFR